jgi:hypothetical protein
MAHWYDIPSRRSFLRTASTLGAGLILPAFWDTPGAFAEALTATPRQTDDCRSARHYKSPSPLPLRYRRVIM